MEGRPRPLITMMYSAKKHSNNLAPVSNQLERRATPSGGWLVVQTPLVMTMSGFVYIERVINSVDADARVDLLWSFTACCTTNAKQIEQMEFERKYNKKYVLWNMVSAP